MKIIANFADVIKWFVAMEQVKTNIIQIGNRQGVVLPSDVLRRLRLSTKSPVNVSVEDSRIIIHPSPRQGWAEAAKQMAEAGDDELLIPDFFEDEDLSWWTWEEEKK